jgi:hypothetical protein
MKAIYNSKLKYVYSYLVQIVRRWQQKPVTWILASAMATTWIDSVSKTNKTRSTMISE